MNRFFDAGLIAACVVAEDELRQLRGERVVCVDIESGAAAVAVKSGDHVAIVKEGSAADLIVEESLEIDQAQWDRLAGVINTGDFVAAINQMLPVDLRSDPTPYAAIHYDGTHRRKAQWKQEVNRHRRGKR